jgi:hypothetical protein
LDKYTGAGLAKAIKGIAIRREMATLVIGRSRSVRINVLPADVWKHRIAEVYGTDMGKPGVLFLKPRDIRDEATMAQFVTEQVDKDWKPLALGVFVLGGEILSYFVPENPYWRGLIEDEIERARKIVEPGEER